ncbi:PadR family transcriptional regulator [Microbacterium oleivorans]|uniref:PadR family transcriptional regulator n=2 Tax=Microbacterium oleivorans TaxID=273677 RepID=A0A7D5F4H1_9MICO|nr:PadR family transcriptional regulator [Microbacterium oleivorans]
MNAIDDPNASRRSGSWNGEWMRGLLPLLVMRSLHEGASYGYAISASLARCGFGGVKGGTLYPLLTRHESAGLVTTEWRPGEGGPGRKYFALTPHGHAELDRLSGDWRSFATTVDTFITLEGTAR